MKITIILSPVEVKGIRGYLKDMDDDATTAGIARYVNNIVSSVINNPRESVSDYIKRHSTD